MRDHKLIRLFTKSPLASGGKISLGKEQAHYLVNVMRRKLSDSILIFNGADGEFSAEIISAAKNEVILKIKEQTRKHTPSFEIALLYAPVKNAKNEFIVQKATEMGVSDIQPVITKHTIKDKVNIEKLELVAIEAAEQCERLDVPIVNEIIELEKALKKYAGHTIILCDETGKGEPAGEVLEKLKQGNKNKYAVVIGPEGGFSDLEISIMHSMSNIYPIGLGPRILRAETAIITALALCQNYLGDFNIQPAFRS